MNGGLVFAWAAAGLLVGLAMYSLVMRTRRSNRGGLGVGLHKAEIIGGWLGVGTLAAIGGTVALSGNTRSDYVGGVVLLIGGLVFLGGGVYCARRFRG
jgi:hypothetical protein